MRGRLGCSVPGRGWLRRGPGTRRWGKRRGTMGYPWGAWSYRAGAVTCSTVGVARSTFPADRGRYSFARSGATRSGPTPFSRVTGRWQPIATHSDEAAHSDEKGTTHEKGTRGLSFASVGRYHSWLGCRSTVRRI